MLKKISMFFLSITRFEVESSRDEISLQMACAVLLAEVMRADGDFADSEKIKIKSLLKKHFALTEQELNEIIEHSEILTEQATDFYQFTSKINSNYTIEEKIKIVDMLWQVANADGEISSIEQHVIHKIADLLHLRHNEYISSKLKILNDK